MVDELTQEQKIQIAQATNLAQTEILKSALWGKLDIGQRKELTQEYIEFWDSVLTEAKQRKLDRLNQSKQTTQRELMEE